MNDPDPEVVKQLNTLAERRFELEVRKNDAIQKCKDAVAALENERDKKLTEIATETKQVDAEIRREAEGNRAQLIEPRKKSFVTLAAKFQFKDTSTKIKVMDTKAVLQVARQLGVVRKIGSMKMEWKLSLDKFRDWLEKNGELRRHFEPYLEEPDGKQSLTIAPNSNYTVFHDSKRISPPSITIKG